MRCNNHKCSTTKQYKTVFQMSLAKCCIEMVVTVHDPIWVNPEPENPNYLCNSKNNTNSVEVSLDNFCFTVAHHLFSQFERKFFVEIIVSFLVRIFFIISCELLYCSYVGTGYLCYRITTLHLQILICMSVSTCVILFSDCYAILL